MKARNVFLLIVLIGVISACGSDPDNSLVFMDDPQDDMPPVGDNGDQDNGDDDPDMDDSGENVVEESALTSCERFNSPQGFASLNGGTTGGADLGEGNNEIGVVTGEQIQDALSNPEFSGSPLTIFVDDLITWENSNNSRISIQRNDLSIIGRSDNAGFEGVPIEIVNGAQNIIIRNLTLRLVPQSRSPGDLISLDGRQGAVSNIWIDHNELFNSLDMGQDFFDELVSGRSEVHNVTISYNKLHDSWKTSLWGSSDNAEAEDVGRTITFQANHWFDVNSRTPLFRFGEGHVFNNFYQNVMGSAINSRMGAQMRIDGNVFEDVNDPIVSRFSVEVGFWDVEDNIFENITAGGTCIPGESECRGAHEESTTTYTPPYTYERLAAEDAADHVLTYAGPRTINECLELPAPDPQDPDMGSGDAVWMGDALNLAGSADEDIQGSIDENTAEAVTITSTGGNVNSSNHQLFFAYQEINYPEFVMTARITNIEGADLPEGNGNRFGMMVMEDLVPVGDNFADLSAWADIGFYVNEDLEALLGSRGQKKEDRTRTRSDIPQLEVGDWVRIEITNEEGETQKRLRRFFSKDGVEFTQANSTTDFQATTDVDNWFVGFYGAPGANEVTISFEDITVEPINPPNPWNGEALNLAGGADEDIAGSILENEADRLVINATGGDVNSSNHQLFFAYQEVALSEFRFTAQITSMEGADIPTGNGKRWGIMVLEDLEPVGNNFFDLSAWADIGFYMNEDLQALLGSRAQKKEDTTRTRSDIPGLEVGDWVRIEITNEEGETQKRLKRLISKDGVEFEQVNSTTDFQATTDVDHWFIGGYAAPGDNDLTMTLENISYEDLSGQ